MNRETYPQIEDALANAALDFFLVHPYPAEGEEVGRFSVVVTSDCKTSVLEDAFSKAGLMTDPTMRLDEQKVQDPPKPVLQWRNTKSGIIASERQMELVDITAADDNDAYWLYRV